MKPKIDATWELQDTGAPDTRAAGIVGALEKLHNMGPNGRAQCWLNYGGREYTLNLWETVPSRLARNPQLLAVPHG